jgi:small subunit ribosomal protein S7
MSVNLNLKFYSLIRKINVNNFEDEVLLYSFLGAMIKKGNKNKTEILFKNLLLYLKKHYPNQNPLDIFYKALLEIKPVLSLRVKKVAGINYQLPSPISNERACKLAVNWFFKGVNSRNEKTFFIRMTAEIFDLLKGKGVSKQKKEALEKAALENRPFIFFLKR